MSSESSSGVWSSNFESTSSTFMCGTISPPILEKRLRRPVMVMNPSSSSIAMSPVLNQPSTITSLVAFSLLRYPSITLGPLIHNIPDSLAGSSSFVSMSQTFAVTLATGRPTVPSLASTWKSPRRREAGMFALTPGESSVMPYPWTGRTPNFSSY